MVAFHTCIVGEPAVHRGRRAGAGVVQLDAAEEEGTELEGVHGWWTSWGVSDEPERTNG